MKIISIMLEYKNTYIAIMTLSRGVGKFWILGRRKSKQTFFGGKGFLNLNVFDLR